MTTTAPNFDFDAIAEASSINQFARGIGAKAGKGGNFHCPGSGHEKGDRNPSLSISRKDGRTVACCHGCGLSGSPVGVAASLWGVTHAQAAEMLMRQQGVSVGPPADMKPRKKQPPTREEVEAVYPFTDENGVELFCVVRLPPIDGEKQIRQWVRVGDRWRKNTEGVEPKPLYRLTEVIEGAAVGRVIVVTEGEKCADRLARMGLVATTHPGGAGHWKDHHTETLRGAIVAVIEDNDAAGRNHALKVATTLHGVAKSVRVVRLKGLEAKGDASDWLDQGHTVEELRKAIKDTPVFDPKAPSPSEQNYDAFQDEEDEEEARPTFTSLRELQENPENLEPPREVFPKLGYKSRMSILNGPSKIGKSTYVAHGTAVMSKGEAFLHTFTYPDNGGRVLWVGLEEFVGDPVLRFTDLGAILFT